MSRVLSVLALSTAFALPLAALAQGLGEENFVIDGETITLKDDEEMERALFWRGEAFYRGGEITIEEVVKIGDSEVALGAAGAGGNACAADAFVLAMAQGKPHLELMEGNCAIYGHELTDTGLRYRSDALPGTPGRVVDWTPEGGFQLVEELAFGPLEEFTWTDFDALNSLHPVDVLRIEPIYRQIKAGLGDALFEQYALVLTGLGSGEFISPNHYAGSACSKFDCMAEAAWLWADPMNEESYLLFYTPDMSEPVVWPQNVESWPEWAQQQMSEAMSGVN